MTDEQTSRLVDWQVCMDWLDVQGAPADTTLIGRLIRWQGQGFRPQPGGTDAGLP